MGGHDTGSALDVARGLIVRLPHGLVALGYRLLHPPPSYPAHVGVGGCRGYHCASAMRGRLAQGRCRELPLATQRRTCAVSAADPQLAVMHLRVRTLRDVEMAEHHVEGFHRGLLSAPCAHTISLLGVVPHPRVPSGPATGARGAPPGAAHTPQWLSHRSAPLAGSVMGHDATVGIDAHALAPLWLAGPARADLRVEAAPSLDYLQGGAGSLGH